MRRFSLIGLCLAAVIVPGSAAHAQGLQTGTVTGIVASVDRMALPGVRVTAASATLQGERTSVTDVNGVYLSPSAARRRIYRQPRTV
jgi:hypothetical protein